MEIYKQDINNIDNEIIKKIINEEQGKEYVNKICLDIKRVIENNDIFKDRDTKEMKISYKYADLDILVADFIPLKEYSDDMKIDFNKLLESFYKLISYIKINNKSCTDIRSSIESTTYFPSYLTKETWKDCFEKYILDKIK